MSNAVSLVKTEKGYLVIFNNRPFYWHDNVVKCAELIHRILKVYGWT